MVSLLPIQRVRSFPFDSLSDMRREIDRIFDGLEGNGLGLHRSNTGWLPPMDIVETDEEIRCTIEVPGVAREDLDISVQGNTLRIAGTKVSGRTEESNGATYRLFERRFGRFERYLTLPERVDANRISARHENGVLTLVLPKAEEAKPRQIPIEATGEVRQVEAGSGS